MGYIAEEYFTPNMNLAPGCFCVCDCSQCSRTSFVLRWLAGGSPSSDDDDEMMMMMMITMITMQAHAKLSFPDC